LTATLFAAQPGPCSRRTSCPADVKGGYVYEKPKVERFGTLRELTLGGAPIVEGDCLSIWHRSGNC
jgi:hypothetical protein